MEYDDNCITSGCTNKEIEFNIFETKKTESNFLEVEANNDYKEETNDPDLID